jgi:hypothetical protein
MHDPKSLAAKKAPEKPPNTRITHQGFIADILVNSIAVPPIYHWVVQRQGSAEIIYWGQEVSFEQAKEQATLTIHRLAEHRAMNLGDSSGDLVF